MGRKLAGESTLRQWIEGLFSRLGGISREVPPGRLHDQRHGQYGGGRDAQAERINLHDGCERRRAPEHREDPGQPHTAYAYNRAGCRYEGYAKAPQIAGQSLLRKAEQVCDKNIREPDLPRGDDVRVVVENADYKRRKSTMKFLLRPVGVDSLVSLKDHAEDFTRGYGRYISAAWIR